MKELEDLLSKLNHIAKEFVPPSIAGGFSVPPLDSMVVPVLESRKKRMNNRTSLAQREDIIKRTVYVSDIDQQVTEEQHAALFSTGSLTKIIKYHQEIWWSFDSDVHVCWLKIVDCRICGDPNSAMRFAFVESTNEEGARVALHFSGTVFCQGFRRLMFGFYLSQYADTGQVRCLRLLGDHNHSTRIAFVEFVMAESAILAINCSGVVPGVTSHKG